jgi:hypothetical protein
MQYFYSYIILCMGCYASYIGAPALSILVVATLLAAPSVTKAREEQVLTIETAGHSVSALIFAIITYALGRGIASVLGT